MLQERGLNYSLDLLFALPGQTLIHLKRDLAEIATLSPPHVSAYCLTIPEHHPMNAGRPREEQQVDMFHLIEDHLVQHGLQKYEISNFAKPGFESRHNLTYWMDQDYWGLGVSSHSYRKQDPSPYGCRFFNPNSIAEYERQVQAASGSLENILPASQWEQLLATESLTDFCHTFLRTTTGLSKDALHHKFPFELLARLWPRLRQLENDCLLESSILGWRLTPTGQMLSNQVFSQLTF